MPPFQKKQQATDTNAFEELCFFPALTLMVFMRRRIGLRMLKPSRIIGAFVLLYLYSGFGVALLGGKYRDMQAVQYFAVAFAILAIAHYWRSWREFNRGIRLHSYSSGISHLEVRNHLPKFFKSHRRIYRMADPFFCMVVGLYVMIFSHPLGLWIAVSSFSLRIFEQARYEAALTRDLDIVDSLTEGGIQQQTVEYFSGGQPQDRTNKQRALEQQSGIPTGVAPDIEKQIAQRKTTATSEDNLQ